MRKGSVKWIVRVALLLMGFLTLSASAKSCQERPKLTINEVYYWTRGDDLTIDHQWIELLNAGYRELDLAGYVVTNDHGVPIASLPSWQLPARAYLVVHLTDGTDDSDFSDGAGHFYAGSAGQPMAIEVGGIALYHQTVDEEGIIDFVAWSDTGGYGTPSSCTHAIEAGVWPEGRFFESMDHHTLDLEAPLMPGQSIGRDASSTNTHTVRNWSRSGGRDAVDPTPGKRNWSAILHSGFDEPALETPAGIKTQKTWTVMIYMDHRDAALREYQAQMVGDIIAAGSPNDQVTFVAQGNLHRSGRTGYTYRWNLESGSRTNDPDYYFSVPPEEKAPGTPEALGGFISWAKENFPARRYALILMGHGSGWKSVLTNRRNDQLTMSELRTALANIGPDNAFDLLFFHSCLMGTVEVGYQVAGYARHMVASEEVLKSLFSYRDLSVYLRNHPDMDGAQLGRYLVSLYAAGAEDHERWDKYTISMINPEKIASDLAAPLDAFSVALKEDVGDYREHEIQEDNLQVWLAENAHDFDIAELYRDNNYQDLYHFAQLVEGSPLEAATRAPGVMDALRTGPQKLVMANRTGAAHRRSHGLSIYFPRALLKRGHSDDPEERQKARNPFDYPYPGPHIYQKDPAILVPMLKDEDHVMIHDRGFLFPFDSEWSQFVHRYYKPVADACIRIGDDCVQEATVEVGETVTLSGAGSTDSDAEDQGRWGDVHRWYWDFNLDEDRDEPLPRYRPGAQFDPCEEDCDRDGVDEIDDDPYAAGEEVEFTCETAGEFRIRMIVWDSHHTNRRRYPEHRPYWDHGRHWLHFNVDDDFVTVRCVAPPPPIPDKTVEPEEAVPGEQVKYEITLTSPEGQVTRSVELGSISVVDTLPKQLVLEGDTLFCSEGTSCTYVEDAHQIVMTAYRPAPGDSVALSYTMGVPDSIECREDETVILVNSAVITDGDSVEEVSADLLIRCEQPEL